MSTTAEKPAAKKPAPRKPRKTAPSPAASASALREQEHPHEAELAAEHAERLKHDREYAEEHARAEAAEPEPDALDLRATLLAAGATADAIEKAAAQLDLPPGVLEATATLDQTARAENVAEKKKGLRSWKDRAVWVITGDSSSARRKPAASKPEKASGGGGPREGSTLWAVLQVLKGKRTPMRPEAIYAEIKERKLAPGLKGKTPEATVAAQLAVAAKAGKHGIHRPKPGHYALTRG